MLVTWRGMFLVRHSLHNPIFCSDSTNTDSNRFFVKLRLLVKFIWYCMSVLSFLWIYLYFFRNSWFFPWMCQKKKNEIPCLCRLGLNAMIRLRCTAHTQVFLAFSSIPGNLHRKFLFSIYEFVPCWHKLFNFITIIVSLPKRHTRIKRRDH